MGDSRQEPESAADALLLMQERDVPSLTEDQVKEITTFLEGREDSKAGSMAVCKQFKVRRLQLQAAGFSLSPKGRGSAVAPPGHPEPEPLAREEKEVYTGPPLEESQIEGIKSLLESHGGSWSLALVGSKFTVKAPQLELAGFVIGPPNNTGQRNVALPGTEEPEAPENSAKRQRTHDREDREPLPDLTEEQISEINAFLADQPDSAALVNEIFKLFGVKRSQLDKAGFSLSPRGRNRDSGSVAPAGHPVPNLKDDAEYDVLEEAKKEEIVQFLEGKGGIAEMAQVGSTFKVKANQLEAAGFMLSEKNANGQRSVATPGSEQPEPPSIEKRQGSSNGKGGRGSQVDWEAMWNVKGGKMMETMRTMYEMKGKGKNTQQQQNELWGWYQGMKGMYMAGLKGMGKKRKEPEPCGPLTEKKKEQVLQFLAITENVTVAQIGQKFKVTKKELLNNGFVVGPPNQVGQVLVAPPGFPEPDAPEYVPKADKEEAEGGLE